MSVRTLFIGPYAIGLVPVLQTAVLNLQALVGALQVSVFADEILVLGRLALVEGRQFLVIAEQQIVNSAQVFFLSSGSISLALCTALLCLQLSILGHERRALRVQGGVLHLAEENNDL